MNNQNKNENYMNSPRYRMNDGNNYNNYSNMINNLQPKFLKPIVQTKVVEVPKDVYVEKIIEVPQIKIVEKIVEDIKPIYKYKNVYKPKIVYVEKIKHTDKIIYEEKIIEVPEKKFVEKVVEIPVYVNREKIIPIPRYMVVERVIPVLKTAKSEKFVKIPEIKSSFIDISEKIKESEKIDIKDLKDNQTTEVTDAEQIRILNQMAGANVTTNVTANVTANAESTIRVDISHDYNMNNMVQEKKQEQQHVHINTQQTSDVYKNQNMYNQYIQNINKEDKYSACSQMFYRMQKYLANNKLSKTNIVPRIKIAKTPHNNTNKNCYCSYN